MFLIGWPGGDLQATVTIVAAVAIVYFGLIWATTILWAYRDIRSRSRDLFSHLVGVALVTVLPLVGIPLYLVLRPTSTLQQAYDRQLEQEAILSELHSVSACPTCRRPVQDDFQVCPHCSTSLKEACHDCGRLLTHAWRHCPYCATPREPVRSAARLEFDADAGSGDRGEAPAEAAPPSTRPAGGRTTEEPATR
ncbi:MAG: zinc ribbon domain-containing protein [Dehalococcoidia bacterium]|nr:zinc ribbon domain-containing protein [Dehalococcoidia bacterium]